MSVKLPVKKIIDMNTMNNVHEEFLRENCTDEENIKTTIQN